MATLSNSLSIGSRALFTQQGAMTTTGHNISNMNTEGYSRQETRTFAEKPNMDGTGGGVKRGIIKRVFDRFAQSKVIQEKTNSAVYHTREEFLEKVEIVFNEMEGAGLRKALNEFWDSWSLLANEPESDAARAKVRDRSDALATRFRNMFTELRTIRSEANGQVAGIVSEINSTAKQIATLNREISNFEIGDKVANDARDQRDKLLEDLSSLVDMQWFEDENGEINVSIASGGWTLVESRKVHELEASLVGGEVGMYHIEGVGKNEYKRDLTNNVISGSLKETLVIRDSTIVNYMQQLDDLAFGLAHKVNLNHTTGTGLDSASEQMKSSFGLNEDAREQPLPFIKDGVLQLHLVDGENSFLETYELEILAGSDTVGDIVQRINDTVGNPSILEAWIEDDGSVIIQSKDGNRFIFGEDTSEFISVMGFNNFFESLRGAEDFRISDRIMKDPTKISTGKDLIPGDNSVALAIAKLQTEPTMKNDTMTFDEFYNGVLADVGLRIQRNQIDKEHQDNLLEQFVSIRDSVSSVNLDEEMTNMVQQQKAYEAAAKYLTVVDEMMETVIRM